MRTVNTVNDSEQTSIFVSDINKSLPATLPKHTVSLLKELANHGCRFAVGQIM